MLYLLLFGHQNDGCAILLCKVSVKLPGHLLGSCDLHAKPVFPNYLF